MSTKFSEMTPEQKREYKRLAARKSRDKKKPVTLRLTGEQVAKFRRLLAFEILVASGTPVETAWKSVNQKTEST
jgi:hypothetical protein